MKKFVGAFMAAALGVVVSAQAAEFNPGIVYDVAGKFDKSFNEAAYNGAEKFKTDTGVEYVEFTPANDAQREQAVRRLAQRGVNPVVAIGFNFSDAVGNVAKDFPETQFAIVDSVVDQPNVASLLFTEHEGSYVVGVLAAMASKTGKVGFVGGMDIPLIRAFGCGFVQGAKSVNANAEVIQNMTGTTPAAFSDPVRGGELAKAQFDSGVDVVFAAAGGTGEGVYRAAKEAGKLAIGVDSNQNHLQPGTMLTSMVKRVDVAVYETFKAAQAGELKSGVRVFGLADQGVDWALDEHNQALVSAEMKAKAEAVKADIITGNIKVHDYRADNSCPN